MTGFSLKMLALITMIIDHIGATFSSVAGTRSLRIIGRLAFPIYAFLISEGCRHTRNFKKYLLRLFIFAFISEIPFNFLFRNIERLAYGGEFKPVIFGAHNVFFTLFLGAFSVYVLEALKKHLPGPKYMIYLISYIFASFAGFFIANGLGTDYGAWGVLMIFFTYVSREETNDKILSIITPIYMSVLYCMYYAYAGEILPLIILSVVFTISYIGPELFNLPKIEMYRAYIVIAFYINAIYGGIYHLSTLFIAALASLLFISKYNGQEGKKATYLFYAAYPLHIIILGVIWYFFIFKSNGI